MLTANTGFRLGKFAPVVMNSNFNTTPEDLEYDMDTSGGAIGSSLYDPHYAPGAIVSYKITVGGNPLTITPQSGTIDGAGTLVLNNLNDSVILRNDGVNWHVL